MPDSIIRLPSLLLLLSSSICKIILAFHTSKFKMASSCHNSLISTLVPLLETPFNTISCFNGYLAYLPNALQCSKQIHQKGHSSPRSSSSTIHPGWTALPIPSPSIVLVDNNSNYKDAPATLTANRPTSFTHSQSKSC